MREVVQKRQQQMHDMQRRYTNLKGHLQSAKKQLDDLEKDKQSSEQAKAELKNTLDEENKSKDELTNELQRQKQLVNTQQFDKEALEKQKNVLQQESDQAQQVPVFTHFYSTCTMLICPDFRCPIL